MQLIGLAGKKGAGKDTAGQYLVERHGYTRLSFAEPLKVSAAALFGIDPARWDAIKNDPYATVVLTDLSGESVRLTAREFLQRYGTEAHRDVFGENFWTDILLSQLEENGRYVVTDSRFENECRALRAVGGSVMVIDRPSADGTDTHVSEQLPPDDLVDYVLPNDGTIEEMYALLDLYVLFPPGKRGARGVGPCPVGHHPGVSGVAGTA